MSYLLLACHGGDDSTDAKHANLKSRVSNVCDEVCKFDVPENLKFGSFDSLIKLMDDLQKYDSQVEAVLKRIERQMTDLDAKAEFNVRFRQKTMTLESYIRSFQWDDTKYPRNRPVNDNAQNLFSMVVRIDDDVKAKAYAFSDVKTSIQNANKAKGTGLSLATADLTEVLTSEVASAEDFVEKEHVTTVVVVVPRGQEKAFEDSYEKLNPFVCPRSAKKFQRIAGGKVSDVDDKDGNTLWRVVLFKKSVDDFRKAAKELKFTVRDFTYDPNALMVQQERAAALQKDYQEKELTLKRQCAHAFSDTLVSWMHLKAMRIFVEAVLRYGVPPKFAAFIVKPSGKQKNLNKLRVILNDVFSAPGLFGASYIGTAPGKQEAADEEEYFPYVSLTMTPITVQ
jgi:V-type H+-transporting ATPase subunit C